MKSHHTIILGLLLILLSCYKTDTFNNSPITIRAHYMQYACGENNDDMKILNVADSSYNFILGKDIDPEFLNGKQNLSDLFFDNNTEKYGMAYQMKGFISKCAQSGCGNESPKFWITEIKKLDGNEFDISKKTKLGSIHQQ